MPKSQIGALSEGQAEKADKIVKVDPQYILSSNSPVVELDASAAFEKLTLQEKKYAHYLSRASWYGGLICFLQGSPEGASIFILVLKVFGEQPIKVLQRAALENGVAEDEFKALLVYVSGILTHCANYKSFGDTKFIPAASEKSFLTVVKQSVAYQRDPAGIDALWQRVRSLIFSLSDREKTIGFPDKGITTYLSANVTKDDTDKINRFLQKYGMEAYNTRAFKTTTSGKTSYEIRLASEETGDLAGLTRADEDFEDSTFRITRGDYSPLMGLCADYLDKAKEYAANELEKPMLEKYVESFRTGSLDAHKDGSRFWIRDKGPVIETYIGFIETYRDPAGQRGEFCGWVAMVNRDRSSNFAALVNSAEALLSKLPWAGPLEKDRFLRPDFTSLDVLTFADSGIPCGINIPNYDCIRQDEGFKNVSLGNVLSSSLQEEGSISFLTPTDQALLREFRVRAFEVQVGLHELLGHGSGKLLRKDAKGTFNFDIESVINPLTGGKIETWYEEGESYDSKFTRISSSYEECRAEAVGLYLSLLPEVMKIFGYEGEEAATLAYVNWLSLLWGVVAHGPESYSLENKSWLQAHTQARFVLLQVLLEAGDGLVKLEESKPGQDLLLSLDREKIHTVGAKAIGDFLLKLQVYKSTADISAASEMYAAYSRVPETGSPWVNWRKIALSSVKPRRLFVQANTQLTDNDVLLKRYEASYAGVITSWAERFSAEPDIYRLLEELIVKDEHHFVKLEEL